MLLLHVLFLLSRAASQTNVVSVSPNTQFTAAVTAFSSWSNGPAVSRILSTNKMATAPPTDLEGDRAGSTGIMLSWTPANPSLRQTFIIRYKEVCPYPDTDFTTKQVEDIPEVLLNTFNPGSTYGIQVATEASAREGLYSTTLYMKTAEAAPGLVTNLTAFAQNYTFVLVTWYLPRRINGLITKFAVTVKNARNSQTVRALELNAADLMAGALPHCNDAADILTRGTSSPADMTSVSAPSVTESAVPPAAAWNVPISVGVDRLRSYTAYLFEVAASTSDGDGQVASTMVRMPESAPEDPPQNMTIRHITSTSFSIGWDPPTIATGRFSYVVYLFGPTGYMYENTTVEQRFVLSALHPFTTYRVSVRAKSAGEVGPEAAYVVITAAEAPGAVQDLRAEAEDSTSIRLSWSVPARPNGVITQYRLQVLAGDTLLRDIIFTRLPSEDTTGAVTVPPDPRRRRSADLAFTTSPPAFTATISERPSPSAGTASSGPPVTDGDPITPPPSATPPPWLTQWSQAASSDSAPVPVTGGMPRPPSVSAVTSRQTSAGVSASPEGPLNITMELPDLSTEVSYVVMDLRPFTAYTFRVTASTLIGEGPPVQVEEQTSEQVPSAVTDVSYGNVSSTSVQLSWSPPLHPNGRIRYYTVYGLNLDTNHTFLQLTNDTNTLLTDLGKYTRYKLRIAASTLAGESHLTEEDDVFVVTEEDEPDSPPEGVAVEDTTPTTVTLTWSPPARPNGVIRRYEVLYGNGTFSTAVNASRPRVTLGDLKPFSRYNVTVRAYTRLGHGGQASDTVELLSGEDVPGSAPYNLTYESIGPSEVNVTWEAPLLPNGLILHYSVALWNATHSLNLTSTTSSLHVRHLRKYALYRVAVAAHTRAGPGNYSSEPLNITTLEDAPDTPPQFLHAKKLSDYQVELSWQPPLEANSDILYYVLRVWNETAERWENVTGTSVVITVDSESQYNASVSSWTRLGDGGVVVSISFTTIDAEPFDPPQNVTVSNMNASSVTFTWSPPTEPNGIIVHYTILYSQNGTVAQQIIPVSTLPIAGSLGSALSYTLRGLVGGVNYTLWMTSSTWQGDGGVHSQPFSLVLPEDVPSGPVRNLTAQNFSSTTIAVNWDPPLEPNGQPTYLLTLREAGPGPPNRTQEVNTKETATLFFKLKKYFPYLLTVTPATGAGPAHNHTLTLHLRTDEDVPSSAPILVSTRNLSASSISVAWKRPLEPNGEITEYGLTLLGPRGSNATHTPNSSITLSDLVPYTPYELSIVARTRKGPGPPLQLLLHTDEAGPMSPPRHLTIFNHTSLSVWLSWDPPLEPNGVVTHYGFRVRDVNTHTDSYQNSSSAATSASLSGFRPHSSYEITVFSYTRVGHGDQYSNPITFTTNESVSDMVGNLSCRGNSWDSVHLSWEPPANPNGRILSYQVRLDSRRYTATGLEHTVTGLASAQSYTLSVRAVNSAGLGDAANCTTSTRPELVPGAPGFLAVSLVTATSVTLSWATPGSVPGILREYRITVQLLAADCQSPSNPGPTNASNTGEPADGCANVSQTVVPVKDSESSGGNHSFTLRSLSKHRAYRFKMAAVTSAGVGEHTAWIHAHTLAGNPDEPPHNVTVVPKSSSLQIRWEAPRILSGPTSYLVLVAPSEFAATNLSVVVAPGEQATAVFANLTAFTLYSVTVTAFTGHLEDAGRDGKTSQTVVARTKEEEPKDPPKDLVPAENVTRVVVTFSPPREPNGNISAYLVEVASEGGQQSPLAMEISGQNVIRNNDSTVTVIIHGLKGGHQYRIRIAAVNGAGKSPFSPEVQITTGMMAPAKPTHIPQAVKGRGDAPVVTHRTITIQKPACFYSDDNGPIRHIQVIVAEAGVKDVKIVTIWKNAFFHQPAPYLTDGGFPIPACVQQRGHVSPLGRSDDRAEDKYVIGEDDSCTEEQDTLCNGRLKPNTVYVFKFRATNTQDQHTDSEYSEDVKTTADGMLTRKERIILGVLLGVFLAVFLISIICLSVRLHQRKNEEATYSPRQAEIIETKFKLDQLIAVADMELKEDKVNRYSSFFFRRKEIYVIQLLSYRKSLKPVNKKSFEQHVADLGANENTKFKEEFAELPKLLQDLATSDADLPWNQSKNRFTNIKPYNNNRVKLLTEPGLAGSDYINASFISGYLCPNEFIATQGPLPGTVEDFWRMVWETGTRTIAMLTQCYEKGRVRCHQYWPEDNKPLTVFGNGLGNIIITKLAENVFPDWTVRAIKVERHGDYIVVHHFNFTTWPEQGVPQSSTLIQFIKAVRAKRHENTTIVVHCSAGVGRTGVFIALDHLIQHISDHDFVDVYGLVAELRSERMCMVQNVGQYMFLHQSTLDLLGSKGNSQSIWCVNYSALEKMDSLEAMEGDVELEWEETTM